MKKGQLLFKVRSTDIAGAYSDYRKAVKNEQLALDNEARKIQLDRAKLLFEQRGDSQERLRNCAERRNWHANRVDNARVDIETTTEHLKLLGSDPDHPYGHRRSVTLRFRE